MIGVALIDLFSRVTALGSRWGDRIIPTIVVISFCGDSSKSSQAQSSKATSHKKKMSRPYCNKHKIQRKPKNNAENNAMMSTNYHSAVYIQRQTEFNYFVYRSSRRRFSYSADWAQKAAVLGARLYGMFYIARCFSRSGTAW